MSRRAPSKSSKPPVVNGPLRWIFPEAADTAAVARLVNAAGVARWAAECLVRRGFAEPEAAANFLQPRLRSLGDPFLLPQMEQAVARLLAAVEGRERIALYGDYDVDGVTSLALLTRLLRAYGADVATFLPHRVDEGYGLTAEGVARCMENLRPALLVAVDCGTTSVAEITRLRESGVDVIVLDHHEAKEELPPAVALVNPKTGARGHPQFGYLCSAGIAFKVAHALLKRRPLAGFDIRELLDLVAIGTVADVVPLVEENRILVRAGLERLARSRWKGVNALLEVSGLRAPFRPANVGFGIGPRLNAAGRLDSAEAALELLLTGDDARAKLLAKSLDQQNRERRAIEEEVFAMAEAQITGLYDPAGDAAIVAGATGWHPGVVGIVASRLQRRHHRPAFVIGFDAMGMGKGSGRSIEGFSLVAALGRCADVLEKFGGHEMAAGLTMRLENLDAFRAAFTAAAREILTAAQLQARLRLDAELRLAEVNLNLLDELDAMQPFGTGNPQPVFFARGVTSAAEPRVMKEKHRSLLLRQDRAQCRAVWWNSADEPLPRPPWDVAFTVARNEWNGTVETQMEIRAMRSAE